MSNQAEKFFNAIYEYDDFMAGIKTLVDLGCGEGNDLAWWATRTTRDESPKPLNIRCLGVDQVSSLPIARKYPNITFRSCDFENLTYIPNTTQYDILWCNNAFQYCINPLQTLANWYHLASDSGMLALIVPQTTNIVHNKLAFVQPEGSYYHYTLVNLIHMLAVTGWDCRSGFFLKDPADPWIYCAVYKSKQLPKDIKKTTWYDLVESKLLPETADKSILAHGYLRQQDLIIPWLDHGLRCMDKQ
jgi:ubiquinone/menaquinone biosynthesis C-methylase UbiE